MAYVIIAIVVVLVVATLVAVQVRRKVNQGAPEAVPGRETPRPDDDRLSEGKEVPRPARPEDRQLTDAGADRER